MTAFSGGGENGTGVSGAAIRLTGASRSSKASSPMVAAISAPKPPVRVSSCRTSTFDVLRADSSTAGLSHGMTVRRSTISTETPSPSSRRAVALLRRHRDELVPGAGDEVGELHLRDGTHTHDRRARARADDRRLGQRRVDHAPVPELLLEAERDLERAAVDADVLADHEHALVAPHLGAQPVGDRLQIRELGHHLWWGVSRSSGVA